MSVTIGAWIFPLAYTIAAVGYCCLPAKSYGYYGADIAAVIGVLLAVITSLAAWLAWALLA